MIQAPVATSVESLKYILLNLTRSSRIYVVPPKPNQALLELAPFSLDKSVGQFDLKIGGHLQEPIMLEADRQTTIKPYNFEHTIDLIYFTYPRKNRTNSVNKRLKFLKSGELSFYSLSFLRSLSGYGQIADHFAAGYLPENIGEILEESIAQRREERLK